MKNSNDRNLYAPGMEHDACGIGFLANLKRKRSHKLIEDAITMLQNMEHRGGCGCEPETGDGAGILFQIPHEFFAKECDKLQIDLPETGQYGVGMLFFPKEESVREECRTILNINIKKLGFQLLGYRKVPVNNTGVGKTALSIEPHIEQVFVTHPEVKHDQAALERKLYVLRKYTTHTIGKTVKDNDGHFYVTTFSTRTIAYKGQLTTFQLRSYYPDLFDPKVNSAFALIHSRFSTNTFPNWKLAHPFRYISHNGEINTIKGNVNWMLSNQTLLETTLFTKQEIEMMLPICDFTHSDSANLDAVIELLVMGGRSLPHVMMMLIPEAWEEHYEMDEVRREFYQYHAALMEPWDGPASICFTDGNIVGATLDRNGLRPSRYCLTEDGLVVMASEAGALPVDQSKVVMKGRLQPGRMFIADLEKGRIVSDEELKAEICSQKPYGEWIKYNEIDINEIQDISDNEYEIDDNELLDKQKVFGFTFEDLRIILTPMIEDGKEPIGSMGMDSPLAILSKHSQHLSSYFKQLFAQVSNPPIDPIRERLVMSLFTSLGRTWNILAETPLHAKQIYLPQPVVSNSDMEKIRCLKHTNFRIHSIDATFKASDGPEALEKALDRICADADEKIIRDGANILIITDRETSSEFAPIPSLMAVGAIHHHLVRNGRRVRAGLIIEAGDIWETHHFATVFGYGANAINPYMAFETIDRLRESKLVEKEISPEKAEENYIEAIGSGLLKIFSKMGISTLQSYHGAQIFEAVGIGSKVIERCFNGTASRIDGLGFKGIGKEILTRHAFAYPDKPSRYSELAVGGIYQWKRRGESHLFNPDTIQLLQQSARNNDYNAYKEFANLINEQSKQAITLRSLFEFSNREPVPIEEVELKENIYKRFATGAMSFGSISHEAHSTLAIAMNRLGGKSNSGEGGEDESRFKKKKNGDWERSAIKQVASGRFGVTSNYLTNANELQIKIAQGAKPGEGGQLPGHKVDDWIGRVRHSTPGVGLISPPPHHDIYSIEDLAQLIFDLKNANREARINVKLVSEIGVGTIAAGVAKGKADAVLISGYDGGTGASPISSIRHAGLPWELGLAETHQTLVMNDLRSRITVQVDGQIRTARDLAIATLLGAEEWGISTAALVIEGCILMRKCHLNTCPVGIATQRKELRKEFNGKAEWVVNYFSFLAEELREIMAELGFRTVDEMVGQADILRVREDLEFWKLKALDFGPIISKIEADPSVGLYKTQEQDYEIQDILDWKLIEAAKPALTKAEPVNESYDIRNTDRTVGAMLSNEISKKFGSVGLPEDTLHFKFRGSAGQSFAAFSTKGIKLELEGEANDYFCKGLSGAKVIIYPDREAKFDPSSNIVIGNVAFYGATSGEAYIRGMAGERFCVRNSGVTAVVEGIGDHGCEYMTGGYAVILGPTGRNFAAGMSGGTAYVYDNEGVFLKNCNQEMVDFDPLEDEDLLRLQRLINNHLKYTKSNVAKNILENFEEVVKYFVKVMPRDYKAVLLKNKAKVQVAI
ncbi:glutamate synthase large subunit [Bacteroidota bacterium]